MTLTSPLRDLLAQATPGPWKAEKREFGWWLSSETDSSLRPGEAPFADAEVIALLRNVSGELLDLADAAERYRRKAGDPYVTQAIVAVCRDDLDEKIAAFRAALEREA